jgi:predicted helicase
VVPDGLRDQVIREHALKNLYGFEYLIAPYTIAHLKLSQFLLDKGFTMQPGDRLQIYLTNTLEPISPQQNFLLPALSKEVEHAQKVKDKPVLVITGNPPYNVKSQNNGAWIIGLIRDYYKVDGLPLGERNPKNLQDDYVKFIRFAQWKMDHVDEGVVGIITNHSFLDNPTFRGMRQSLMQTFNLIYVLDLHGSVAKKSVEREDENVFDIEQGVAISIFVKNNKLQNKVYRGDLWGKRKEKYQFLAEGDVMNISWKEVFPVSPYYVFAEQDAGLRQTYDQGIPISKVFVLQSSGIKTHRDALVIGFDQNTLIEKLHKESIEVDGQFIMKMCYRPFDERVIYYHKNLVDRPREDTAKQLCMTDGRNLSLATAKQYTSGNYQHAMVSENMTEMKTCSHDRGTYFFPLYRYNFREDKKPTFTLFDEDDPFNGKDRIENISAEFRAFIDKKYEHAYSPEEILSYVYTVLHSPTYREKYSQFLKNDFPRIPFVDDPELFQKLSKLGWELVRAHLLKDVPEKPKVEVSKNDDEVESPVYDPKNQRIYANKNLYFAPVPEDVWNFHIGGYQVLDKYLKSRNGRKLALDEKENIINVVKVIRFTIDQMVKIDEIWKP